MLKHLELRRLRLVEFLLKLADVCRGALKLGLELLLAGLHGVMVRLPGVALLLHFRLLGQHGIFLQDCTLQLHNRLLALTQGKLQLIHLRIILLPLLIHHVLVLGLHASHIIRQLFLQSRNFIGMHLFLLIHFFGMLLLELVLFLNALLPLVGHVLLKALDLDLELLNFLNQTVLVLFLQLGVLLDLLRNLHNLGLELLSDSLAIADELLVFGDIFLQIIENLQLLVQCNQSVQLVLKLDFLVLERELKLVLLTLVKH